MTSSRHIPILVAARRDAPAHATWYRARWSARVIAWSPRLRRPCRTFPTVHSVQRENRGSRRRAALWAYRSVRPVLGPRFTSGVLVAPRLGKALEAKRAQE